MILACERGCNACGVDAKESSVHLIHRGKHKTLTRRQRRWLKGQTGDALHVVLCAAGYNLLATARNRPPRPAAYIFYPRVAALARQCHAASITAASCPLPTFIVLP
jgi:hypothetical protein